jgi:O-antigen ligase
MKTFSRWIIACLAALAFLAPLKFGTPVVTQALLIPPSNFFEWVFFSWPNQIVVIFAFTALLWLVFDPERVAARTDALFLLPLAFLATQALATLISINRQVSADTLMHFATCVLLFYAAAWYVRDGAATARIFGGLGLATFLVAILALQQHFGGLQEAREFAALYSDRVAMPKDLLLRITSNRVFAWFGGYPNALAGYLVAAFAPTLAWIWVRARNWDGRVKWLTLVFAGGLMGYCLLLTGSRGGFVAFAAMIVTGLFWCIPKGRRGGFGIGLVLLVLAGTLFVAQRRGLVTLGRSSLEARGDYWRGAVKIAHDHFWLGTGPGTFGSVYPKYKTAQTEEAQLVHNNFLEMWSDSGLPAFIVFAALWLLAIRDGFRLVGQRRGDVGAVAVCAALTGWVVHGMVDFDLYVPGVGIPAFLLLGILQGLKELPSVKPVAPQGKAKWVIGLVCAVLVGAVVWIEGRSLAAGSLYGQATGLERENPVAAFEEIRRAVSLSPDNAFYQAAAGSLAVRLGKFDEAIGYYRAAINNDPFRASYHWRLARAEMAAHGVDDKARQQLQQAVALNPTNQRYRQTPDEVEESVRQSSSSLLQSSPAREK